MNAVDNTPMARLPWPVKVIQNNPQIPNDFQYSLLNMYNPSSPVKVLESTNGSRTVCQRYTILDKQ